MTRKLTEDERRALTLLRQLHERQREKLLARMEREVMANNVVKKVAKVRDLDLAADRRVERAFGSVPTWKAARRKSR